MTTGVSLYEIEGRLDDVLEQIVEAQAEGREIPAEAIQAANEYAMAAAEKRDRCALFLDMAKRSEDAIAAEIADLRDKLARRVAAREKFEDYILEVMRERGVMVLAGNHRKFRAVTNPKHVAIDPDATPEDAPEQFVRVVPETRQWDKAAIKRALEAGEDVPFAWLADGGVRLAYTEPKRKS